jgi:NAD(P)-dependent dehydrogenase (short-subunit alcohol dehydrogenase family)
MRLFSLANKTALVTGASSGLGRHFANVLADAGAHVVLAARRLDKLEELAGEIQRRGGKALPVEMDVTSEDSVTGAFAEIREALGRPCDILVNNSGLSREGWFWEMPEKDWDTVIETNLTGVWRVAKYATKAMIQAESGGSIINIASITALRPSNMISAYSASKAAVDHLTRTMALEGSRHGIRVNAIAPTVIMTDRVKNLFSDDKLRDKLEKMHVLGFGEAIDIAQMAVYLASDESRLVTGQVFPVDSGLTVK